MRKIFIIFLTIFTGCCVFAYSVSPDRISLPKYSRVVCKFTQQKTFPNSKNTVKSGGNFEFNSQKGVIFETLYPVKTTTSYTISENKKINDIITAINKKDYTYLKKNFELDYIKNGSKSELTLKPKQTSKAYGVINNIKIESSKFINKIYINGSSNTEINFTECSGDYEKNI